MTTVGAHPDGVTWASAWFGLAHWCQRWTQRRASWRHASEGGFDHTRYDVAPIPEAESRPFCCVNHYTGTYPAARFAFGLFDGVWLVGVAVFSNPTQAKVLTNVFPELTPYGESLELGRFVLADTVPANAETWFLARCWELLAREGIRGVVAFSDPVPRTTLQGELLFPGHVGLIYQSANAMYLGRATSRLIHLLPDGRVLNARALQKVLSRDQGHAYVERLLVGFGARPLRPGEDSARWLEAALHDASVRRMRHPGNHRYAFRVGPRRRLVALMDVPRDAARPVKPPCPCPTCRAHPGLPVLAPLALRDSEPRDPRRRTK